MKKISIVVPTLNTIKYIEACMNSIINQTFRELEIIVVDAGSSDGTKEYLKRLALQDDRIVLIDSDKRSYGYQLNLGIEYATGEYIGIVESDDIIELNMYETLYNVAIMDEFDYVKGIGQFFWENEKGNCLNSRIEVFTKDRYSNGRVVISDYKDKLELLDKDYYLWTGLYTSSFIKAIKFNETPGAAFQDVGFLAQAYYSCKKVCYIDRCIYNYRQTNLESSSVNHKGFRYILDENTYLSKKELWKAEPWKRKCLFKAFRQANRRIQVMAAQGEFWSDKEHEIEEVRQLVLEAESKLKLSKLLLEWEKEEFALFIENPHKLYEKYKEAYDEWNQKRRCFDADLVEKGIVVFGCGEWGSFAGFLIDSNLSTKLVGFADNASILWGTEMYGKPIMRPEHWTNAEADYYYLIANKMHSNEIYNQLLSMGADKDHIMFYDMGKNVTLL